MARPLPPPRETPSLAMEEGAMTGGTTSPSLLPPPAPPPSPRIHSSPCSSSFPSPSPLPPPARLPSPRIRTANTTEQGGQAVGDLRQDPVGGISVGKETSWPSSKKKRKKESGKACGETQRSDDARVVQKITSKTHVDQRDSSKVPISETVGGKRSLSHASESSRARKAAKIINAKVEMTRLKNSKTPRIKMSNPR